VEEIGGGQREDSEVRHFLEILKEKLYIGRGWTLQWTVQM
jgi:hypothetical protein